MHRLLPLIAATIVLLWSCTNEEEVVRQKIDGNVTPTMITDSVNSFVSDSGITRYHLTAPKWLMFDEADEPFWLFPMGMYLEQFDDNMTPQATVRSDTARYYSRLKIWKLDGNVRMRNTDGDRFLTSQLFWNQETHKVYSDSFVHIERENRILEGYGFISNEQITAYTIRRPSGIFPTDGFDSRRGGPAPAAADTPQPQPEPLKEKK